MLNYSRLLDFISVIKNRRQILKSISMIASANLAATALGMIGSLVQAHFIAPEDLGFVRKYSIVSGYAIFLSLGLFSILQREYPVLVGRGEHEEARRVAAIVQSWSFLTATLVCGVLLLICLYQLVLGNWRESSAWFIQVVSVWTILYGGYLACTFRTGHEFEKLAKSSYLGSLVGIIILPFFTVWPFMALVIRSVAGSIATGVYQHMVRPVKIGWLLPWSDFSGLVKRGMRLFVGTYLRYHMWGVLEIWLMLRIAGDSGVGLLAFSSMLVVAVSQFSSAVNQIYMPRLAQHFGESGDLRACLRMAIKPTIINVVVAALFSSAAWLLLPELLRFAFPNYVAAIPLINVLLLDTMIVGLSLPLHMIPVLEDSRTQTSAAIISLIVMIGVTYVLHASGMREMAVVWGTIAGRSCFAAILMTSLLLSYEKNKQFTPR